MFATLFGLCAALALAIGIQLAPGFAMELLLPDVALECFFAIALFFSSLPWVWTLFLSLNSEMSPISALALCSNIKDRKMYLFSGGVIAASFAGLILVSQLLVPLTWCFAISLILIGIILDLLRKAYFRLQYRRSPEGIAESLIDAMRDAVKKQNEGLHSMSFEAIFSLMVAYLKNDEIAALRLFCRKMMSASDLWLGIVDRISLYHASAESDETLLDRYSIAEARVAKRLAWVIKESCDTGNPTVLEEMVRLVGRLFLMFHGYHHSLGFLLLVMLSQVSHKVEGKIEPWDRDVEVMAAFSEVVKALIDKSLERGASDTESIIKVLAILETYVKESFRREKSINPAFLMQPFAEIGQMLAGQRYNALLGRDEIISVLKRTLAQFAALETVSSHLETSGPGTDTKASFIEDLPFTIHRESRETPS